MNKSFYCVHDCETGGLDKDKNPITQYACVILDPFTLKEVDRFETFIKPYNNLEIDKAALEHTMVTMSDIKGGISVKSFYKTLSGFWGKYQANGKFKDANRIVSVGHNIPFDHGFLEYAFQLHDDSIWNYLLPNFIDTFPIAKMAWCVKGNEKLTLTACTERAKINLNDAHGAMNDVEATADLFRWFMKKLRSGKGDSIKEDSTSKRQLGQKFFEFQCAVK